MSDRIEGLIEAFCDNPYSDVIAQKIRDVVEGKDAELARLRAEVERLKREATKDPCLKCNHFNRPDICLDQDCPVKESWFAQYQKQKIESAERLCKLVDEKKAALFASRTEVERLKAKILELETIRAELEADARRFPTMAEFSNLQDWNEELERKLAGAEGKIKEYFSDTLPIDLTYLMPCGEGYGSCSPGYKKYDENGDWNIQERAIRQAGEKGDEIMNGMEIMAKVIGKLLVVNGWMAEVRGEEIIINPEAEKYFRVKVTIENKAAEEEGK
ncbi:MAG: hypothetical protein WC373_12130 [Smithella sp.]|jgi:hypothetical protein